MMAQVHLTKQVGEHDVLPSETPWDAGHIRSEAAKFY